jgi:hypothetical protein
MPYLDFEVDFALAEDGVTLGRLNDFGETLTLSPDEFEVALMCDGVTTLAEAAMSCCGEGESTANDVIARLSEHASYASLERSDSRHLELRG